MTDPNEKQALSPLAQTFEAIKQAGVKLLPKGAAEFNYPMWQAAANLSMGEYAAARRLKAEWASGARWG